MNYQQLFYDAIRFNQIEAVKELLKRTNVDANENDNYAIRMASCYGHVEIVKELLKQPNVDASVYANWSIRTANDHGYFEIVKVLVKNNKIINMAKKLNQIDVLQLIESYQ